MMKMRNVLFMTVIGIFLIAAYPGFAGNDKAKMNDGKMSGSSEMMTAEIGKMAPGFKLMSADGKEYSLDDFRGKFVVLEWVNFDCPFVKKQYGTDNMQSLQAEYGKKGVVWLSICSSAPGKQGNFSGMELSDRMKKEKWNAMAYLIDADGTVGRMYGAKTTPHMFVVDPKGTLIYAGGIDDRPTPKPADVEGATNYVRLTLDAAMNGKAVPNPVTPPYGCGVKY